MPQNKFLFSFCSFPERRARETSNNKSLALEGYQDLVVLAVCHFIALSAALLIKNSSSSMGAMVLRSIDPWL
jgi:hypothetical protein